MLETNCFSSRVLLLSGFYMLFWFLEYYFIPLLFLGIKTKVVDVTKKDQVEALAKDFDYVDVLFNVAGFVFLIKSSEYKTFYVILKSHFRNDAKAWLFHFWGSCSFNVHTVSHSSFFDTDLSIMAQYWSVRNRTGTSLWTWMSVACTWWSRPFCLRSTCPSSL